MKRRVVHIHPGDILEVRYVHEGYEASSSGWRQQVYPNSTTFLCTGLSLAAADPRFKLAPWPAGQETIDLSKSAVLAAREAALREAANVAEACERQNYSRVTDTEHHSHYRAGLRSAGQAIRNGILALIPKDGEKP